MFYNEKGYQDIMELYVKYGLVLITNAMILIELLGICPHL